MSNADGGVTPTNTDGGTNAAEQQQNSTEQKPITLADIEALLTDRLPKVVNSAVTNQLGRVRKDLDAKLALLAPKPKPEAAEGDGDGSGGDERDDEPKAAKPKAEQTAKPEGKGDDKPAKAEPDPMIAELRKQAAELSKRLAKQEKDIEEARKRADAERRARIESTGYENVRKALTGKVIPDAIDDVLDLFKSRGQVMISDDGDVRLKFGGADEPEEGLDVESGVAAFLKTKKAQLYIPPPSGGGGGGRPRIATHPGSSGSKPSKPEDKFSVVHGKSLIDAALGR